MSKEEILDKTTDTIERYVGDDYSIAYNIVCELDKKEVKLTDKQKNELMESLSDLDICSGEVYLKYDYDSSFMYGIRYNTCHKKLGYLTGLYELSVEEFCDFLDISPDISEEEFSDQCQYIQNRVLEDSKIVFERAYEELDRKLKVFLVEHELVTEQKTSLDDDLFVNI